MLTLFQHLGTSVAQKKEEKEGKRRKEKRKEEKKKGKDAQLEQAFSQSQLNLCVDAAFNDEISREERRK